MSCGQKKSEGNNYLDGGCTVGCVSTYKRESIQGPIDGHNISPWVKVFFKSESEKNPTITVGNNSSPAHGNSAAIKSFSYGLSNGAGVRIEIVDEEGGAFHKFTDKLSKCMKKTDSDYSMQCKFGWTIKDCDGTERIGPHQSPTITFIPLDLEISFSDGAIKCIISGQDLMQHVFASRQNDTKGQDDQPIHLKEAITKLCTEEHPKMKVQFNTKNGPNTLKFEDGPNGAVDGKGPKQKWPCDGENKLATIQGWLKPFRTASKKGCLVVWCPLADEPTLIILEDPKPGCDEQDSFGTPIGTYIVNGGRCSPVLSFTPTINGVVLFATEPAQASGSAGGAISGKSVPHPKHCQTEKESQSETEKRGKDAPQAGIAKANTISVPARDAYPLKEVQEKNATASNANDKANIYSHTALLNPIDAELRIQGDPRAALCDPTNLYSSTISLVVINPFHIIGGSFCGDWLARPGCNDTLSNKNWMIIGAEHNIKEGSYTTTLKLTLPKSKDLPDVAKIECN